MPRAKRRAVSAPDGEWLLLIHHLPPSPAYLRVKVSRRLHRIGAVPVKNSVYLLPNTEAHLEDFQWLVREISAGGGEAVICVARFLTTEASDTAIAPRRPHAHSRNQVTPRPHAGTWVTRRDVFVDRMASAWLIRRFIDPAARFRFVASGSARRRAGEIRFDMFGGEYTHVGDRCTFETLVAVFRLGDPRLRAIAEIVHDIDLKDAKFGRSEVAGVRAVLEGIRATTSRDAERLERAATVFEALYDRISRSQETTARRTKLRRAP